MEKGLTPKHTGRKSHNIQRLYGQGQGKKTGMDKKGTKGSTKGVWTEGKPVTDLQRLQV